LTDDEHREASEPDPVRLVVLLHAYYSNLDRAGGTSRELMYLHLGLLSGVIMRQADELRRVRGEASP
jgi:hypothetical protein